MRTKTPHLRSGTRSSTLAAPSQQQPELALQGTLFGLEPIDSAPQQRGKQQGNRSGAAGEANCDPLDEAALAEDANRRPRQRQQPQAPAAEDATPEASGADTPDSDLPPWHHHSLVEAEQLTPMLRHYVELKATHPERVLLYRLGDFFECFFEDAIQLSRLLELTLTGKEGGKAIGRVPMAGIPHHAAERYCAELVSRGLSVALCDQVETPPAKGALLKR